MSKKKSKTFDDSAMDVVNYLTTEPTLYTGTVVPSSHVQNPSTEAMLHDEIQRQGMMINSQIENINHLKYLLSVAEQSEKDALRKLRSMSEGNNELKLYLREKIDNCEIKEEFYINKIKILTEEIHICHEALSTQNNDASHFVAAISVTLLATISIAHFLHFMEWLL